MGIKPAPAKTRGRSIDLPDWWLVRAKELVVGISLVELAESLSKKVKREPPWDRTTVGDFLKGTSPTAELVDAFLMLFEELPPFAFLARSYEEADQIRLVCRRFTAREIGPDGNPDRATRHETLTKAKQQHQAKVADQTKRIDSVNGEGTKARRRPRGVARGRSTTSRG